MQKKNKNVSSEKQELYRIIVLAAFCFADIVLAVFVFWMFEDWSFIRALHFCVVTLSTVGYGDISPTRTGTKIFCCFYILTIVLSVVKLLSMMVEYIRVQGRKDKVKKAVERGFQLVEIFDEDGDGKITRYEYLKKMLVLGDYVELEEIEQLMVSFDEVDGDQNGVVDISEIKAKFATKGHTQYNFTPAVCDEAKEEEEDHPFSFNGDEEEEDNPLSSNGGEDFSHELKHGKRSAENGPSSPEHYNEPAATDEKGEFNHA